MRRLACLVLAASVSLALSGRSATVPQKFQTSKVVPLAPWVEAAAPTAHALETVPVAPTIAFNITYTFESMFRYLYNTATMMYVDNFDNLLAISLADGNVMWEFPDLTVYTDLLTNFGILVLYHDNLIVALQQETGAQAWSVPDPNFDMYVDPADTHKYIYGVDTKAGLLVGFNGLTGARLWNTPLISSSYVQTVNAGVVFVVNTACSTGGVGSCFTFEAINGITGKLMWNTPQLFGFPIVTFGYLGSNVYISYLDVLTQLSVSTGAVGYNITASYVSGSIALSSDSLYFTMGPNIFRVSPSSGAQMWQELVCSACFFSEIVTDDANLVYVQTSDGDTETLYALSKANGAVAWSVTYSSSDYVGISLDKTGYLYIMTTANSVNYDLKSVHAVTGEFYWTYTFPVEIEPFQQCDIPFSPLNGQLYVVCKGNVLSLQLPSPPSPSSGPSGGVIAAAVICSLVGVAVIGAAVWYLKFKRPGYTTATFARITSGFGSSKPIVGTSSSAYTVIGGSSSGSYNI